MGRPSVFTWPAPDPDGICAAQQSLTGALVLNGALVQFFGYDPYLKLDGIQRAVTLTSTEDLSDIDFTVTGTDLRGNVVSEVVVGPNNETVATTAEFHTVTSVVGDAAVEEDITVGTGVTGSTNWWIADTWQNPFNVGIYVVVADSITYTVEYTQDNVQQTASPAINDLTALAAKTTTLSAALTQVARAVRLVVDTSTDGSLVCTIQQAG